VIDLASRRVQIVGSTPYLNDLFMRQISRTLTAEEIGLLCHHRVLICDRDGKWNAEVRQLLGNTGIEMVLTPVRAPNANAYAERFVRSIKEECLARMIPLGERHFSALSRSLLITIIGSGIIKVENELIAGAPATGTPGRVHRRARLGGLLNYYERAA
jgi:putative transposase